MTPCIYIPIATPKFAFIVKERSVMFVSHKLKQPRASVASRETLIDEYMEGLHHRLASIPELITYCLETLTSKK